MTKRRKPCPPCFIIAELFDGQITLITDEGDEYHVEMPRRDDLSNGWPIMSRRMRWRDHFNYVAHGKPWTEEPPRTVDPPRGPFGPPKLIA